MRSMKLFIVAMVMLVSVGCSREPELTPEQRRGLEIVGQIHSETNRRRMEALERIDALDPPLEADSEWLGVSLAISEEYCVRYERDGFESAVEWLEAESRKSKQDLIESWGHATGMNR